MSYWVRTYYVNPGNKDISFANLSDVSSVTIDKKGNIIIVGSAEYSNSYLSGDFGFVAKFDMEGTVKWFKLWVGQSDSDYIVHFTNVSVASEGDIVILGRIISEEGTPTIIMRMLPNGQIYWQRLLKDVHGISMDMDEEDNIFITGDITLKMDKNGNVKWAIPIEGNKITVKNEDVVIATSLSGYLKITKIDKDGNIQWERNYRDSLGGYMCVSDVFITDNEDVIVVGYIRDESPRSGWIVRTDKNGNIRWYKRYTSSRDLVFDSVNIVPDESLILSTEPINGARDAIIAIKLDNTGGIKWARTYKLPGSGDLISSESGITSDGVLFLVNSIQMASHVYGGGWYSDEIVILKAPPTGEIPPFQEELQIQVENCTIEVVSSKESISIPAEVNVSPYQAKLKQIPLGTSVLYASESPITSEFWRMFSKEENPEKLVEIFETLHYPEYAKNFVYNFVFSEFFVSRDSYNGSSHILKGVVIVYNPYISKLNGKIKPRNDEFFKPDVDLIEFTLAKGEFFVKTLKVTLVKNPKNNKYPSWKDFYVILEFPEYKLRWLFDDLNHRWASDSLDLENNQFKALELMEKWISDKYSQHHIKSKIYQSIKRELGKMYFGKAVSETGIETKIKLLTKAVELGYMDATRKLGEAFYMKALSERDFNKKLELLKKAEQLGCTKAKDEKEKLLRSLFEQALQETDFEKKVSLLKKADSLGYEIAGVAYKNLIEDLYMDARFERDLSRKLELLKRVISLGPQELVIKAERELKSLNETIESRVLSSINVYIPQLIEDIPSKLEVIIKNDFANSLKVMGELIREGYGVKVENSDRASFESPIIPRGQEFRKRISVKPYLVGDFKVYLKIKAIVDDEIEVEVTKPINLNVKRRPINEEKLKEIVNVEMPNLIEETPAFIKISIDNNIVDSLKVALDLRENEEFFELERPIIEFPELKKGRRVAKSIAVAPLYAGTFDFKIKIVAVANGVQTEVEKIVPVDVAERTATIPPTSMGQEAQSPHAPPIQEYTQTVSSISAGETPTPAESINATPSPRKESEKELYRGEVRFKIGTVGQERVGMLIITNKKMILTGKYRIRSRYVVTTFAKAALRAAGVGEVDKEIYITSIRFLKLKKPLIGGYYIEFTNTTENKKYTIYTDAAPHIYDLLKQHGARAI